MTVSGLLCLRRWPREHPSRDRLVYIHAVLRHIEQAGFKQVPCPITTIEGASFIEHAGYYWELSRWLDGEANYKCEPSSAKLVAAMSTLGQFHTAAATFPSNDPPVARSPGLLRRLVQLQELLSGRFIEIAAAVRVNDSPELESRARSLLELATDCAPSVLPLLEVVQRKALPLQPCIRDVWSDHILFQGERVSGVVDFGAMSHESVAGDVARLLGSLVGDDRAAWQSGLEAYQSERSLSEAERRAVDVFDRSGVLLSGINWLEWIYIEGRRFENRERIIRRLDEILTRLRYLRLSASAKP